MYNPYDPRDGIRQVPGLRGPTVRTWSSSAEKWPSSIFLGLAVTAHADAYTSTAVFSNFDPYTPGADRDHPAARGNGRDVLQ